MKRTICSRAASPKFTGGSRQTIADDEAVEFPAWFRAVAPCREAGASRYQNIREKRELPNWRRVALVSAVLAPTRQIVSPVAALIANERSHIAPNNPD